MGRRQREVGGFRTTKQAQAALDDALSGVNGTLVAPTTAMVAAETAYLLARELGPRAEPAFYDPIIDGSPRVERLHYRVGFDQRGPFSPHLPNFDSGADESAALSPILRTPTTCGSPRAPSTWDSCRVTADRVFNGVPELELAS